MTPLDFALEYIARGWSPIPIPHKRKKPAGEEWPGWRITKDIAHQRFNGGPQNIGVLMGEASGGLADVDLDTTEAVRAAPYFLPRTLCFGRPSKLRSHWLYQSGLWQTEDKAAIQFKFATGKGKDRKEQMILELRIGGGGKGAQTVFPGSAHETGEPIAWDEPSEITQADGEDLKQRCARAASAALLAGHFPSKGARHDAGLTLGGFLARCGVSRPDTELFAEAVTIASGQPREKVKDVRKAASEAWDESNRSDGKARGFPLLAKTFGDDVAKHVAKWLGYQGGWGEARAGKPGNIEGDFARESSGGNPVIKIAPGELPRLVDETEAAIMTANRGLYKREGQIVRVAEIEVIGADEKKATALAIVEQTEHAILEDASASATYLRFNKKEEVWVRTDPPMTVIKVLQGRMTRLRFPPLMGIVSAPLILTNGRVIDNPGYDARTGLYFDPLGTSFPPIPKKPTQEDAQEALNLLDDLLQEFPFTNDASKAVALSGLLTAVLRRAIDFAFMHTITAPAFGSGKSYLVDLFCMLATGRCAPVVSPGKTPEEFEKRLDSALLKGFGVIAIDNMNGILEGDKLAQILSQAAVEVRLFGTQRNLTVAPASLVTATGINLRVVDDLRRRTLLCSLDAKEERPELRTFKTDPLGMIKAERGRYVAAALTIIRGFMAAGSPRNADPINGYAQYCAMIRDPLIWLSCADPCATMEEIRKQDSHLAATHQVAAQWLAAFGEQEKSAAEIVDLVNTRRHTSNDDPLVYPEFRAALSEIVKGKGLDAKSLGYWLRAVSGQIITLDTELVQARYSFRGGLDKHMKITLWKLCREPSPATVHEGN
jgi:Bifunctional DNA primase/polymerase, N-terminal